VLSVASSRIVTPHRSRINQNAKSTCRLAVKVGANARCIPLRQLRLPKLVGMTITLAAQRDPVSRKSNQTTPLAEPCSTSTQLPRIAVSALLQLTRWCQEQRHLLQGGDPCPASHDESCPANKKANSLDQSETLLGAASAQQPQNARPDSGPNHCSEPSAVQGKGGSQ